MIYNPNTIVCLCSLSVSVLWLQTRCSLNTFKTILLVIFVVLFTALIFQNTEVVDFQFLFFETQMSRAILFVMFLVAGLIVGYFLGRAHQRRRTRHVQERQARREQRKQDKQQPKD